MTKEIGEPAFPVTKVWEQHSTGMTLRDYFAAKAMVAVDMSNYSAGGRETRGQYIARIAYAYADAMLEARNAR